MRGEKVTKVVPFDHHSAVHLGTVFGNNHDQSESTEEAIRQQEAAGSR